MNSGRQNDHIWSKKLLHNCDGYGSCLINNKQFCLRQFGMILRSDVLNCLPVISENINSDYGVIELRIGTLQNFIILVLFVIQAIKSFQDKIKKSA